MEKTIKIKCKGSGVRDIDELIPYQGELKILPDENYKRLRDEIIDPQIGFVAPFSIWRNKILDGHQRLTVLKRMRDEEHYIIPKLPVVEIEADDVKAAKKTILSLASVHGRMTDESLLKFIKDEELDLDDIVCKFDFGADIDFNNLETLFNSQEIDDDLKDDSFGEIAKDFEEEHGKGKDASKKNWLYVQFPDEKMDDYDFVKSQFCGKSREMDSEKLIAALRK